MGPFSSIGTAASLFQLADGDWTPHAERIAGNPEVIPGQKSASGKSPVISSNAVYGPGDEALKPGGK
jgi:hypothetical protein